MCYKVPLDNIWYISKSNTKFLKIFLKGKTTEYSVLFIWKIAFKNWSFVIQKVSSEKKCYYMISGKFVSVIIHKEFYPSALKYLKYYPPGCTHPCFLVVKKNTQSCEILVPKIRQVVFLTFSSYSVNILPNYLRFFESVHCPISRYLFLVI